MTKQKLIETTNAKIKEVEEQIVSTVKKWKRQPTLPQKKCLRILLTSPKVNGMDYNPFSTISFTGNSRV